MSIPHILLFGGALFLAACGGISHWDTSLDRAELQGKSQAWFEDNWGNPSAKAKRFFGGETWVYFRICLLYTSDAADEGLGVDLGGRRII